MDVEVSVPATVANLGPGFDCLGAALGLHLRIRFGRSERTEIAGLRPHRPAPENLTHLGLVEAFKAAGTEAPPVRIETLETYPSGRGLGASASAIVAGVVAARLIGDLDLPDEELGRIAIRIEGHGDNVLPAFFGGIVLYAHGGWMRFEPSEEVEPIVLVAREKFRTEDARRVLPVDIPRQDAVANAAAAAALVAILSGRQAPEGLLLATEDRMHEPYRLPLMRETLEIHSALRSKGVATALAGAGPSLICLVERERRDEVARLASEICPEGWQIMNPGWDLAGAQVR